MLYIYIYHRDGFVTLDTEVPPGDYIVVISTFQPNKVGSYILTLETDNKIPVLLSPLVT